MKDLFIQYTNPHGSAALRDLTVRFNACREQLGRIEALHGEMKIARGTRLPHDHKNDELRTQRDREYDVALIRVELEQGALYATVAALHQSITTAKTATESAGLQREAIMKNNVMCAEELCKEAMTAYFAVRRDIEKGDRMAGYYFGINRAFREQPADPDPREFVVMYSGHGSHMRYENEPGDQPPPPPYLTLSEAQYDAERWELTADTIGGRAQVVNVRTGKTVA
jgi:hypothetical protein